MCRKIRICVIECPDECRWGKPQEEHAAASSAWGDHKEQLSTIVCAHLYLVSCIWYCVSVKFVCQRKVWTTKIRMLWVVEVFAAFPLSLSLALYVSISLLFCPFLPSSFRFSSGSISNFWFRFLYQFRVAFRLSWGISEGAQRNFLVFAQCTMKRKNISSLHVAVRALKLSVSIG